MIWIVCVVVFDIVFGIKAFFYKTAMQEFLAKFYDSMDGYRGYNKTHDHSSNKTSYKTHIDGIGIFPVDVTVY